MIKLDKQLSETLQQIGRQVIQLRESMGLDQDQFAKKCGWDRTRQSRIESGKYNMTVETLIIIANASAMMLGISFSNV
jgi:transcriptional regulator with XRE-family HTH domain